MPRATRNKSRKRSSVSSKKKGLLKLSLTNPIWAHDQALLEQSFADTQVWAAPAEHIPRFGMANSKDNKVFNFVQTYVQRSWLVSNASTVGTSAFSANLNTFAQSSTFQSLFDQWRIHQMEVWLKPSATNQAQTVPQTVYTVIDYDDATPLTSEAAATQYTNVTITDVHEGVYRRWQPHIATAAWGGSLFTSYENTTGAWLDVGSPAVPHYGFKALVTPAATLLNWDLEVRLWLQVRNVF